MKKIFTLILFVCTSTIAFAQVESKSSTLSLKKGINQDVKVEQSQKEIELLKRNETTEKSNKPNGKLHSRTMTISKPAQVESVEKHNNTSTKSSTQSHMRINSTNTPIRENPNDKEKPKE